VVNSYEFVLVKELLNNDKAFEHLQITNRKFSKVKKEIQALCAG
jgi:glutaredoxin-related protein